MWVEELIKTLVHNKILPHLDNMKRLRACV